MNKKEILLENLKKKYGNSLLDIKNKKLFNLEEIGKVSTNLLNLDYVLGGGIPEGRILEIYGPPSSGKTSICLQIAKAFKSLGKIVLYIDAENALDLDYIKVFGIEEELFLQVSILEDCFNIIRESLEYVDLCIIDSVASLAPKSEVEASMEEQTIGLQARLFSKALRVLSPELNKHKTTLILINQTRTSIGGFTSGSEITPGGNAIKFYSSIRLQVKRSNILNSPEDNLPIFEIKVKTTKNKLDFPYKEAILYLSPREGFDELYSLVSAAIDLGILVRQGNSYFFEGTKIAGNKKDTLLEIQNNLELQNKIIQKTKEGFKNVAGYKEGNDD